MIVVKKSVVAYFLDSCNLGSRIVDFDDTEIVIDKHVRAVTFVFHKGETVATSLSVGNLGCGEGVGFWLVAKDDGVVARCIAKPRRRVKGMKKRGIDVISINWPSCQGDLETVNHTFFNCGLAKELWSLLAKWWDLDIRMCGNIAEWHAWLGDLHIRLAGKAAAAGKVAAAGTFLVSL
ncbi:hypothetical protein Tco_0289713 [Tanacetum coccineum]